MIVYPAIDIRQGRVVRLRYGDPDQETVHGDDPLAVAERWKAAGASWLHVVSLDGTLGEAPFALDTLRALAGVGLPVQFGGGLRTLDDAARALDGGAARVVLGTLVCSSPPWPGGGAASGRKRSPWRLTRGMAGSPRTAGSSAASGRPRTSASASRRTGCAMRCTPTSRATAT